MVGFCTALTRPIVKFCGTADNPGLERLNSIDEEPTLTVLHGSVWMDRGSGVQL